MVEWWAKIEHGIVECLGSGGPMSPGELGHRVGLSEGEAVAFLCMLARERKVSIRLVGLPAEPPIQAARGAAYPGEHTLSSRRTADAGD